MREGDELNIDLSPSVLPLQSAAQSATAALVPRVIPLAGAIQSLAGLFGPNILFAVAAPLNNVSVTVSPAGSTVTFGLSGVGELAGVKSVEDVVPPTAADDSSLSYSLFSVWVDQAGGPDIYMCVNASLGAAVWIRIG